MMLLVLLIAGVEAQEETDSVYTKITSKEVLGEIKTVSDTTHILFVTTEIDQQLLEIDKLIHSYDEEIVKLSARRKELVKVQQAASKPLK